MRWTEILVEEMLADLLAGLMKLSGREDGNKCLKNNIFTFGARYSFESSCPGSRSTRCTDILSNKEVIRLFCEVLEGERGVLTFSVCRRPLKEKSVTKQ